MEYTKSKVLVLLLFFIVSCDCPDKIPITKESMVNEVSYEAAKELKKERSLYLCGMGGRIMYEIRTIALSFSYYHPVTIEEGRELVIAAAQKLADKINTEPRIRSYLYKYPFPPTRTEIRIFVDNLDHVPMQEGAASILSLVDGIIKYEINDPVSNRLFTVYQETYAEGLEKLNYSLQSTAKL